MKDYNKLQQLLEEVEQWPLSYTFKFIVKAEQKGQALARFDKSFKLSERASKNGSFVSITAVKNVESSDEVIKIYQSLSTIDGIISL